MPALNVKLAFDKTSIAADSAGWGLVADIGGTNGRLALASPQGDLVNLKKYECKNFSNLDAMIEQYRSDAGADFPAITAAAFSIAGLVRTSPERGDWVRMTNLSWDISVNELKHKFEFPSVTIVNDFKAIGMAVPHLRSADVLPMGTANPVATATKIVCGPGTGFGFGTVTPDGTALPAEAGHAALFAPADARMAKVAMVIKHLKKALEDTKDENAAAFNVEKLIQQKMDFFRPLFTQADSPHSPGSATRHNRAIAVSQLSDSADMKIQNRDLLTGRGLRNIFRALCLIEGRDPTLPANGEKDVTAAAIKGHDSVAAETVNLFWSCLGETAANLAVESAAMGGVYIAGGIAYRLMEHFDRKPEWRENFMAGFKNVGPHDMSALFPINFVDLADPALLGLQKNLPLPTVGLSPSPTLAAGSVPHP